jgi:MerR family transcriptional regulator, redox-sensitive transcriptional activator SoxR
MSGLTISEVARRAGVRASTLRYYEQIGILPAPQRVSGQRRYDTTVLHRLAVIQRARDTGFTLKEIRQLFSGFRADTPASERWRRLSEQKLVELDAMMERVKTMHDLLRRMRNCPCETLDQCGKRMVERAGAGGVR